MQYIFSAAHQCSKYLSQSVLMSVYFCCDAHCPSHPRKKKSKTEPMQKLQKAIHRDPFARHNGFMV